jgi:ATP-binding cassette subfamily F protein 3
MLEKMKPITALVTRTCARSLSRAGKALSPPIIALDNVSVGYDPGKPGAEPRHAAHRQ